MSDDVPEARQTTSRKEKTSGKEAKRAKSRSNNRSVGDSSSFDTSSLDTPFSLSSSSSSSSSSPSPSEPSPSSSPSGSSHSSKKRLAKSLDVSLQPKSTKGNVEQNKAQGRSPSPAYLRPPGDSAPTSASVSPKRERAGGAGEERKVHTRAQDPLRLSHPFVFEQSERITMLKFLIETLERNQLNKPEIWETMEKYCHDGKMACMHQPSEEDLVRMKAYKKQIKRNQKDGFQVLPDELVLKIFFHIPLHQLLIVARVNRRFHRLASDPKLWNLRCNASIASLSRRYRHLNCDDPNAISFITNNQSDIYHDVNNPLSSIPPSLSSLDVPSSLKIGDQGSEETRNQLSSQASSSSHSGPSLSPFSRSRSDYPLRSPRVSEVDPDLRQLPSFSASQFASSLSLSSSSSPSSSLSSSSFSQDPSSSSHSGPSSSPSLSISPSNQTTQSNSGSSPALLQTRQSDVIQRTLAAMRAGHAPSSQSSSMSSSHSNKQLQIIRAADKIHQTIRGLLRPNTGPYTRSWEYLKRMHLDLHKTSSLKDASRSLPPSSSSSLSSSSSSSSSSSHLSSSEGSIVSNVHGMSIHIKPWSASTDVDVWDEELEDNKNVIWAEKGPTDTDTTTGYKGRIVQAATLNQLINILTAVDSMDLNFVKAFLMTFESFGSCEIIFVKLLQRYRVPQWTRLRYQSESDWLTQLVKPLRLRVINVLKLLVEKHVDRVLASEWMLERCLVFVLVTLPLDGYEALATPFYFLLQKKIFEYEKELRGKETFFTRSLISLRDDDLAWDSFSEAEFAIQLTLLDHIRYRVIKSAELLNVRWRAANKEDVAPNLLKCLQGFDALIYFLQREILKHENVQKRAATIERIVNVMKHLKKLNNFQSLIALIATLTSFPINRLKSTWDRVPQETRDTFEELSALSDASYNYRNFRQAISTVSPPCVPFIGFYLINLEFLQFGRDWGGMIPFRRHQKIYEIISDVLIYQNPRYEFSVIRPLFSVLYHLSPEPPNEDLLANRSTSLEPGEN